jgi:membrane protein required for colicin V production
MNTIDVIVFLFLTYGLIKGLIKGFIVEIAGMIALFIGVLGAFKFSALL